MMKNLILKHTSEVITLCGRFFRASKRSENQLSTSSLIAKGVYERLENPIFHKLWPLPYMYFKIQFKSKYKVEILTFSNKLVSGEGKEKPFSADRLLQETGKQPHNFSLIVKTPKIMAWILITTSLTFKLLQCMYVGLFIWKMYTLTLIYGCIYGCIYVRGFYSTV